MIQAKKIRIKDVNFVFLIQFSATMLASTINTAAHSETITLQADQFEHIEFKRIKTNQHHFHKQQLQISVNDSSSFLMQAFKQVKQVHQVTFEWRSQGAPKIESAQQEEQRSGDDSVFKLGLLLKANSVPFNPFMPSWMKQVESILYHPSEKMIYLSVGTKHTAGDEWINPYNKRVTMIAVGSSDSKDGWEKASYQFDMPVDAVALWLMADGDNTHSSFTVEIKNISIQSQSDLTLKRTLMNK